MANVSSVVKHFPSAKEGFVTTLASTISSGAATVPLNSVTGYNNGDVAVLIVEPGSASAKQAVTGTVDTSGVQLTNCVWTEGTNQTHNAGSTVVDYVAATHMSMVSKGLLVEHDQDGGHSDITADSIVVSGSVEASEFIVTGAGGSQGWESGLPAPDTITYNGDRNYTLVFNGADHTDIVSPNMLLRATRTVTAPTQCADLEASSSQYFNDTTPAGTTFTDDFVAGGWVKLESYGSGGNTVVGRYNGTSGWILRIGALGAGDGRIQLIGFNAGSANFSCVVSRTSIQLNRWTHIAAQLDMSAFTATSTTSYVMIDGEDHTAFVQRGGTNPTALVQAGDLSVGANNSGGFTEFFDGKLSNVWYSSAKITQANVQTLISQSITSAQCTTHSIVSAWTFNNTLNDVNTTSANNLTAQNSAAATNADTPFSGGSGGTQEYAKVETTAFSTNTTMTVRVPEGYAIPTTGGISAMGYSSQAAPYGFPGMTPVIAMRQLNVTATATSIVAVDGLTITFNALANTRYKITFQPGVGISEDNSGAQARIGIALGSVSAANLIQESFMTTAAANQGASPACIWTGYFVPGSVTIIGSLRAVGAGTASLAGATTNPVQFILEEY